MAACRVNVTLAAWFLSGLDSLSSWFFRTSLLVETVCACWFVKLTPTLILCFRGGVKNSVCDGFKLHEVDFSCVTANTAPFFSFFCFLGSDCIKTATSVVPPVVPLP